MKIIHQLGSVIPVNILSFMGVLQSRVLLTAVNVVFVTVVMKSELCDERGGLNLRGCKLGTFYQGSDCRH
jgi:hypothetical protein